MLPPPQHDHDLRAPRPTRPSLGGPSAEAMMSPRSFKYSSSSASSSSFSYSFSSSPQSPISTSTSITPSTSASSLSDSPPSTSRYSRASSYFPFTPSSLSSSFGATSSVSSPSTSETIPITPPTNASTTYRRERSANYEQDGYDHPEITSRLFFRTKTCDSDASMAKRKDRTETTSLPPSSPPTTTTDLDVRPTTPTSPVQIPRSSKRLSAQSRRSSATPRRKASTHAPAILTPSMAALLAVTDIPRPRAQRKVHRQAKSLTVEDIYDQQLSEKELSLTLSRVTMDMLLTPPEDLDDDVSIISDSNIGSAFSTRSMSVDSMPSLGDSFATDQMPSLQTPTRSSSRRRSSGPSRKSMELISSPPESVEDHPLAFTDGDLDDLDENILEQPLEPVPERKSLETFKPLRAVFKSNLTASLRALRSAAKSFSSMSFSSIPPEDMITRSLLTMDPNVPYSDERMPPISEDMPSAEVRRYLNPSTSSHHDTKPATPSPSGSFSASIQMRTYKVQRSTAASPSTHSPYPNAYLQRSSPEADRSKPAPAPAPSAPGMRQREMRENSDFIRIAVMEMAMRKRGKLDDQQPGRARWALPPRKPVLKPYGLNCDGVPERWIPITH